MEELIFGILWYIVARCKFLVPSLELNWNCFCDLADFL